MPASASCRALTPVGHDMTFNGGDEASMHTHFFPTKRRLLATNQQ